MVEGGSQAPGLDALVNAIQFSQEYGQTGQNLVASISAAVDAGVNPTVIAKAVSSAKLLASEGKSARSRVDAVNNAEEYLLQQARDSEGKLKGVMQTLSVFIGRVKQGGGLQERLRAFDRVLDYLLERSLSTLPSDTAARAPKRRRDAKEQDPSGAGPGPASARKGAKGAKEGTKGAKGVKRTTKPAPKAAASRGAVKSRAARASARARARGDTHGDLGQLLIKLINESARQLPEDEQDTASSDLISERQAFLACVK